MLGYDPCYTLQQAEKQYMVKDMIDKEHYVTEEMLLSKKERLLLWNLFSFSPLLISWLSGKVDLFIC